MHELERIDEAVRAIVDRGGRGLLLTVIGTRGSTFRRAGARAVVDENGAVCGAISGGCLERDAAERAAEWLDGRARVVTYDSSRADDVVFGLGLGCRGEIELLVQPFDAARPPRVPRPGCGVFATVIASKTSRYQVGDAIAADVDATCRIELDGCDVFAEVVPPQRAVVIFGRGSDARAVAALAHTIGWRADVLRNEEANLTGYDAAVVMTHSFLTDRAILAELLKTPTRYIGLLGPRSRAEDLLESVGPGPATRARIHAPVGLDLGAETPEEIALSIVAEMQAVLAGRPGTSLSESDAPIHGETAVMSCV